MVRPTSRSSLSWNESQTRIAFDQLAAVVYGGRPPTFTQALSQSGRFLRASQTGRGVARMPQYVRKRAKLRQVPHYNML
jgi:hypothetical protein